MNIVLDFAVQVYSRLYSSNKTISKILSPIRFMVKSIANYTIPLYFKHSRIIYGKNVSDVIISLTSFPLRINNVYQVIQCLLRQTVRPQKIILWLSKSQFEGVVLPTSLTNLTGEYFEIRLVEGDIRSHKKYYYVLKEYPHSWILLVDDDLYYPTNMLESLIEYRNRKNNCIVCRYGNLMRYDAKGDPLPYSYWWPDDKIMTSYSDNSDFFFGTGGGCLIKHSLLYKDVLDINLALKLTPIADDVWINAMANLAGSSKIKIPFGLLLEINNSNNQRLCNENVNENKNDIQIDLINQYYEKNIGQKPFYGRGRSNCF